MPYPILKFEFNRNHYYDNSWFHKFFYEDYFGNVLSKDKYRLAKSFNEGVAFVYKHDKTWDIINSIGDSILDSLKYSRLVKLALTHVTPKDFFFIKNYKVGHNLIISINFDDFKKELNNRNLKTKYFEEPHTKNCHLIINLYTGYVSLIEDYTISGNGLIGIKLFGECWKYISMDSFNNHQFKKEQFEGKFDFACAFQKGLAKVKRDGYFGFINTQGNFVINPLYDDARSFSNGFAAVSIANCRKYNDWNVEKRLSDLAWNFIDKDNKQHLNKSKDNLSRIDEEGSYFYEDYSMLYTLNRENINPEYFKERFLAGVHYKRSTAKPYYGFWCSSNILGEFSASYLIDLLTAQISDEIGFKKWFIESRNKSIGAYEHVKEKVVAETFYIDFDTTQTELDYINGLNSLKDKYGNDYTSENWKSKPNSNNSSYGINYDDIIDWSNYNDDLDMDQQSIDFWNQF